MTCRVPEIVIPSPRLRKQIKKMIADLRAAQRALTAKHRKALWRELMTGYCQKCANESGQCDCYNAEVWND